MFLVRNRAQNLPPVKLPFAQSLAFVLVCIVHPQLRIYALRGRKMRLAWCRDRRNDWRSEFDQGVPPRTLSGLRLKLASLGLDPKRESVSVDVYDPWQDKWKHATRSKEDVALPDFQRSLVVRVRRGATTDATLGPTN